MRSAATCGCTHVVQLQVLNHATVLSQFADRAQNHPPSMHHTLNGPHTLSLMTLCAVLNAEIQLLPLTCCPRVLPQYGTVINMLLQLNTGARCAGR